MKKDSDPATVDILGTWRLVALEAWEQNRLSEPFVYGENPNGLIHYLPGNRVAAVIAKGNRPQMRGPFGNASVEELATAARTFTAYAGRYSREGAKLIHHIEVNTYENDVGQEYERWISVENDRLVLTSASYGRTEAGHYTRAVWRRV